MCAHPHGQFARVWLHNEMLQVEGKKMSKSLGNFFTVRDLLDKGIPGEVIRFVLLSTHYSKPMDFTVEKVQQAEATLRRWRELTSGMELTEGVNRTLLDPLIVEALSDDINTPLAISRLYDLAQKVENTGYYSVEFILSANALGLLLPELANWSWRPQQRTIEVLPAELKLGSGETYLVVTRKNPRLPPISNEVDGLVMGLVKRRNNARREKNFTEADRIRNQLAELGVEISDSKGGMEVFYQDNFDPSKLESLK
jgi:cysteinyl-tRNA synthetase